MCMSAGAVQAVPVVAQAEDAGPLLTIPLEPVGCFSVTTPADNVTDLLAADTGPAKRPAEQVDRAEQGGALGQVTSSVQQVAGDQVVRVLAEFVHGQHPDHV